MLRAADAARKSEARFAGGLALAKTAMLLLELFSGSQGVSRVARDAFGWKTLTLDWEETTKPDICADMDAWRDADTDERILPACAGHHVVVWMSPDCRHFSIMRNTPRDLHGAMRPVQNAWRVVERLRAANLLHAAIMENPYGMLVQQPYVKERVRDGRLAEYLTNYCKYSSVSAPKKPTNLWSTPALPGFEPRRCYNDCEHVRLYRTTGKLVHPEQIVRLRNAAVRAVVPDALVRDVFEAVDRLPSPSGPPVALSGPSRPPQPRVRSIAGWKRLPDGSVQLRLRMYGGAPGLDQWIDMREVEDVFERRWALDTNTRKLDLLMYVKYQVLPPCASKRRRTR